MTHLLKSVFALAPLVGALCLNMRASEADDDFRWCAVTNKGDVMTWDCDYGSSEECASAIAGTGGFCAINPTWHTNPSSNGH